MKWVVDTCIWRCERLECDPQVELTISSWPHALGDGEGDEGTSNSHLEEEKKRDEAGWKENFGPSPLPRVLSDEARRMTRHHRRWFQHLLVDRNPTIDGLDVSPRRLHMAYALHPQDQSCQLRAPENGKSRRVGQIRSAGVQWWHR